MIPYRLATFTLLFTLLLTASCSKSPNDGIPSYVQVDAVTLSTDANSEGSNGHFINSLWLESEGEFIGTFELPIVAPALISGTREVIINAGVYVQGDYFNREIYPAYKPFVADYTFTPGEKTIINPVFEYYEDNDFPLIEDFESGNVFGAISRTALGDANNVEGKALHIELDAATPSIKGTTSSSVYIPQNRRVYIEMQYKSDVDFAIGIESLSSGSVLQSGYIDRFYTSDDWYKIYYEISAIINELGVEDYNFFIEAIKLDSATNSNLYMDNFKIVVI